MNVPKISVCLIVRDEILQLEKCLLSFKDHVDEIVIVDTGSTDGSQEIAKKYAHIFEQFDACNNPETGRIQDFSMARQRSFDLATGDFVLWVDADDEIAGAENLRKIVARIGPIPEDQSFCMTFPYEYAYDSDGNPIVRQYRERFIYPKKDFHWVNPVHEVLNPDNPNNITHISDEVVFKHRRDGKFIEPRRNLAILQKLYEEIGESDARQLYYLGLEYGNVGENESMLKFLHRYIELSGWDDEKYFACLRITQYHVAVGEYEKAIDAALKAITCKENWGEAYFVLCKCYYFLAQAGKDVQRNWERSAHFGKLGLSYPPTKTLLFVNPVERDYEVHTFLNVSLSKVGDVEGALESAKAGLKHNPNDENLITNKRIFEEHLGRTVVNNKMTELKDKGILTEEMYDSVMKALDGNPNQTVAEVFLAYDKPAEYPNGLTDEHFPVAKIAPHKNAWMIPDTCEVDSLPVKMTDGQLQAVVQLVWKEFIMEDEILSAISFLEKTPYRVKHTETTEKSLNITRKSISWLDDLSIIQNENSTLNTMEEVETGVLLPHDLNGQTKERFYLTMDQIQKYKNGSKQSIVDFGCFDGLMTNRYGLAGYDVVGIDLTEKAVNVANNGAQKFNTGAKHVVSHFNASADVVAHNHFDFATSNESYEHLRNPVEEMIKPAMKMLKEDGKFFMGCPYGSVFRGLFVPWGHIWERARKENISWLVPPRAHLIAPTPWSAAKDFRDAGMWVKNSYAHIFDTAWVPNQGNIILEAHMKAPKNDNPLDIVFWVGNGLEAWTPKTVEKTGIGGSELMSLEMSKRLALMGHRVRMYVGCGEHGEGIYDGVEYLHTEKYHDLKCDVLIVSRNAQALDDSFCIKYKLSLLWVHDVVPIAYTNELLLKADKILCLSEWHKQNVIQQCGLHPDHIIVTRNGIDISRFKGKNIKRNKYKCINSSSPDRSWLVLLQVWPKIKEQVPEATLTLAYGWKNWEYSAQWDQGQQELIKQLKNRIEELKPLGVNFIGRVNQKELAEEMLSSGTNLHCTWFTETSGITFMENQAAGLIIISSSIGALNETVSDRGTLIDGVWTDQSYQDKFIQEAIKALTDE